MYKFDQIDNLLIGGTDNNNFTILLIPRKFLKISIIKTCYSLSLRKNQIVHLDRKINIES